MIRNVLVGFSLAAVLALLACQSTAPAPPTSAAPAAAPVPTQAPAGAPAQSSTAPTAASAQAPAAAAPETIRLGIAVPMTGAGAYLGVPIDRFVRLNMDDVNAKGISVGGKTYRFEAITVDSGSTGETGLAAAQRLTLAEKVKFIIGPSANNLTGMQAVTDANKVLVLAAATVAASMGSNHPLNFEMYPDVAMRVAAEYDWLSKDHPEVKRIAFVGSDDPSGRNAVALMQGITKAKGITVVSEDFYPLDLKDFNPIVTRLLERKFDAIDLGITGGRGPLMLALMRALHDQGYVGITFAMAADIAAMKEVAAGNLMDGFTTLGLVDFTTPAMTAGEKEIVGRYVQKYGSDQIEYAGLTTANAPMLLAQAMVKAGTVDDTTKIGQALNNNEFDAIFGKARFGGAKTYGLASVLQQPIYLTRIKNGKIDTFQAIQGTLP